MGLEIAIAVEVYTCRLQMKAEDDRRYYYVSPHLRSLIENVGNRRMLKWISDCSLNSHLRYKSVSPFHYEACGDFASVRLLTTRANPTSVLSESSRDTASEPGCRRAGVAGRSSRIHGM